MFKLFLFILLNLQPTWSYMKIVFGNKATVYHPTSRNDSNIVKMLYFEGELMYASCVLLADGLNDSNLRFKKRDKLIYESKVTNHKDFDEHNVIMQIKMLPEYNHSVLECTHGMDNLSVLILLDESIPDYALKVNGIWFYKLPDNLRAHIYYKNSNNEDVSISVRTKDKINKDVENQEDSTRQGLADDDITVEISYIQSYKQLKGKILMTQKPRVNTRVQVIVIDCGSLCFDPYIVNLDPSKVLAKFVTNTAENHYTSVVKYELDFEENALIGCTSVSGKGYVYFTGLSSLFHETSAYLNVGASGRYICKSFEDGRFSTTILDVTRKNKTTIKKQDGRLKDITTNKSMDKISTITKGISNTLDKNINGLPEILIAIFVTMITTSVVIIVIYTICLKRRHQSTEISVDETNQTPADGAHFYETIGCGKASEPGDVVKPQREPYPLPPKECEENEKYVHYDTPYEWRIFRNPFRRAQPTRNVRFNETQE